MGKPAEELSSNRIQVVNDWISAALGDSATQDDAQRSASKLDRYASARSLASKLQQTGPDDAENGTDQIDDDDVPTSNQLVYGELSIPVLAKILDAVGVQEDDVFLDIGSGDGALVLGACLLYPDHIVKSYGAELIPGLVERADVHLQQLRDTLASNDEEADTHAASSLDRVEFMAGDIYNAEKDPRLLSVLQESTLAVCFATTWCHTNSLETDDPKSLTSLAGRRLPQLSASLTALKRGARVVIVDGKLDENDGFLWEGDLKVICPDTAPYSTASLYSRL